MTLSGKNIYRRLVNVFYIVTLFLVNLRIHYTKSMNILHLLITAILFIAVLKCTKLSVPTAVHSTYSRVAMLVINWDS